MLFQFSKILEQLFVQRLDNFIGNLLKDHQYGFRARKSTSLAVMELAEHISTAIDNEEYTVGVFIDLKKAFDTIDHCLLLKKLEKYGVKGVINLENRYQYVQVNNCRSE